MLTRRRTANFVHSFGITSSTTRIQVPERRSMDMVAPAWTAGMVIHKFRKYLFVLAGPKDPVILLFIQPSYHIC
jgi:hypothetical protein